MTNEQFSTLVEQYERLVFTVCYQMVRDYQEAQNLAQETFLAAYRHIESCPEGAFKPWLTRIAANKAKDFLKSAYARRVDICGDEELERFPARHSPEEAVVSQETCRRVCERIGTLREPYLMVSQLYFLEEKSMEEISCLLDRPKKTVQTQLYRARALLQELLKEERGA